MFEMLLKAIKSLFVNGTKQESVDLALNRVKCISIVRGKNHKEARPDAKRIGLTQVEFPRMLIV